MSPLWVLFIAMQILSAGHINYQQEAGYYEINPTYGKHPTKSEVYIIKGIETGIIYAATKVFPKYENAILIGSTSISIGFMVNDKRNGIALKVGF